ncbi:hypothetical protein scyTo_0002453 [Scyliorhinus torazame]|uniref:Uncharacterized protein n=1 Tax=Scyliorhinus torazame TaxID=75743 RepID=A0A401PJI2_SCYTO|nr:hypothetical protein [Scyliorhinus torazame]
MQALLKKLAKILKQNSEPQAENTGLGLSEIEDHHLHCQPRSSSFVEPSKETTRLRRYGRQHQPANRKAKAR